MDALTASAMLELMGTDQPHVYVVGLNERRVTIKSQQLRALNLVSALAHRNLVGPGKLIAVVGGGICGVTTAAALSCLGSNVILLEREPDLLASIHRSKTLQRNTLNGVEATWV
jgi:heterodisulfide reductase subunit A-like polyferredoxin